MARPATLACVHHASSHGCPIQARFWLGWGGHEKLQAEVRQESKCVRDLLKMTENWKRSQTIREFLLIYRNQLQSEQQPIEVGSELEKWLDWAEQQADRLDPLVQSPPSILDRAHELIGSEEEADD